MLQDANTPSAANHQPDLLHIPVLLDEVLHYLDPKPNNSYLDLTAGYGGHASRVLERTQNPGLAVLIDRDPNAIAELTARFSKQSPLPVSSRTKAAKVLTPLVVPNTNTPTILQQDFLTASVNLQRQGKQFDCILADLGMSSQHLNIAARGFSIVQNGPLDMRMDTTQELSADIIVNNYNEQQLHAILVNYGEEPKARTVAKAIIAARPIHSTAELARIVAKVWYGPSKGHSKVHPATRTFQAIRIAVNDELHLLTKALPVWINLLQPEGRIVIVSFQSLEDRLVKNIFADHGSYGSAKAGNKYDSEILLLTKRPITAESTELVHNPRARSAKLRAAVKIKI